MRKPDGCKACPMYGDGKGYVADEICEDATRLIVGGSPILDDESAGRAFVNTDGVDITETYGPLGGCERGIDPMYNPSACVWETNDGNTSFMNVIRCRWVNDRGRKTNDRAPKEILNEAIKCCRQYDVIQPTIKAIVAVGELAWRVLADDAGSVVEWRGRVVRRS